MWESGPLLNFYFPLTNRCRKSMQAPYGQRISPLFQILLCFKEGNNVNSSEVSCSWFLCKNWAFLQVILACILCKAGTRISLIATLFMKATTSYQKTQKSRPGFPGDKSRANPCSALDLNNSHIPIKDPAVTQLGQIKHTVLKPSCLLWNKMPTSPWQENFLGNFGRFQSKKYFLFFSLGTCRLSLHCTLSDQKGPTSKCCQVSRGDS